MKRIACVAVSRNIAALNWIGAHIFLTYRALEIALHNFCFVFDLEGAEGRLNMHWET
jgi:hypothetical protein